MPSYLTTTTPSLNFGTVVSGNTADLGVQIINNGNEECTVTLIEISPDFTQDADVPFTVGVFGGNFTWNVSFAAGAIGTFAGELRIASDDPGSPIVIGLSAVTVGTGKYLSVNPSSFTFDATKVGVDSAIQVFVVTNTGDADVIVTGTTFPTGFLSAAPVPGYPVTLHAGDSASIGCKFHPIGQGYVTGNLSIASDAIGNPTLVAVAGTAFLITPAFIATGTQVLLAAFGNTVLQFDPADFDCEEDCTLTRDISLYAPGYQASLMRVQLNAEAKGAATLNIAVTNRHGQTSDDDVVLSTATDDSIKAAFGNLSVTDEVLHVVFTRSADDGPVSITGYIYNFTPAGEVVPETP